MKAFVIIFILFLLGFWLFHLKSKRKNLGDNAGRRSGKDRRKTFKAKKNYMRRSNLERRSQPDRRKLLRTK